MKLECFIYAEAAYRDEYPIMCECNGYAYEILESGRVRSRRAVFTIKWNPKFKKQQLTKVEFSQCMCWNQDRSLYEAFKPSKYYYGNVWRLRSNDDPSWDYYPSYESFHNEVVNLYGMKMNLYKITNLMLNSSDLAKFTIVDLLFDKDGEILLKPYDLSRHDNFAMFLFVEDFDVRY